MVCIQKIFANILRVHLAVQASSIDSTEKQRLTIEKFLQASLHGSGATPMDFGPCQDQGRSRSHREDPIRNRRAKAKVAKAKRERRPLTSGQTVRKIHRLMRSHRGGCRSLRWCCQSTREVQSTRLARLGKNPETGTRSVEILQEWKPLRQCC